ncbi:hypothetical protein D3C87_2013930 [compost metagenome]
MSVMVYSIWPLALVWKLTCSDLPYSGSLGSVIETVPKVALPVLALLPLTT